MMSKRENYLGFCFPFETAAYRDNICVDIDIYIYKYKCIYISIYVYAPVSKYIETENGTNRKLQLPFVCCKQKTEMANFCLFSANRK
jgi:hypothetical protein